MKENTMFYLHAFGNTFYSTNQELIHLRYDKKGKPIYKKIDVKQLKTILKRIKKENKKYQNAIKLYEKGKLGDSPQAHQHAKQLEKQYTNLINTLKTI